MVEFLNVFLTPLHLALRGIYETFFFTKEIKDQSINQLSL